jgi:anti-sigma B factor antagonist
VSLSLTTRSIGDVAVISCDGRIVEGDEAAALQARVAAAVAEQPHVVLDLSNVTFIDSAGLGMLTRLLTRARTASGDLKLSDVPPKMAEVLRITRLHTLFDVRASVSEAVAAFYEPAHATAPAGPLKPPDVLCVDGSVDVLAYVRHLLTQGGYSVQTAVNVPDALVLLTATRPKALVVAGTLRIPLASRAPDVFERLTSRERVIELPPDFSTDDAGRAATALLDRVRSMLGGTASVAEA